MIEIMVSSSQKYLFVVSKTFGEFNPLPIQSHNISGINLLVMYDYFLSKKML